MSAQPSHRLPVRVLIVDDDPLVRKTIERAFTTYGWSVEPAETPAQALTVVREAEAPFHLMVIDLVLADDMGGLALADLLHRAEPDACFLFISGYVDPGIPTETLPGVPKDFLGKPLSVSLLVDRARKLLQAGRTSKSSGGPRTFDAGPTG